MAAARTVVGPMGVLTPESAWWQTEPTTVGILDTGSLGIEVAVTGMHLLQCVACAAGTVDALADTVLPEDV